MLGAVVATMHPWAPTKASRAILIGVAFLGVSFVAGCSGNGVGEGRVGVSRSRIAYGTLDTRHTAVVALLSPVGAELQECSGSIVAVTGSTKYIGLNWKRFWKVPRRPTRMRWKTPGR